MQAIMTYSHSIRRTCKSQTSVFVVDFYDDNRNLCIFVRIKTFFTTFLLIGIIDANAFFI